MITCLIIVLSTIFCTILNSQNVEIPNAIFKSFLLSNEKININLDQEIQVSEASAFNGSIKWISKGFRDLTGIESFPLITWLDCDKNELKTIKIANGCNINMRMCNARNNAQLKCIVVNDPAWSEENWRGNVDLVSSFAKSCK